MTRRLQVIQLWITEKEPVQYFSESGNGYGLASDGKVKSVVYAEFEVEDVDIKGNNIVKRRPIWTCHRILGRRLMNDHRRYK
jgi:hypothetical protein